MSRVPRTVTGKFELNFRYNTAPRYAIDILPFETDLDLRPIEVDRATHDAVSLGSTVYVEKSLFGVSAHLAAQ